MVGAKETPQHSAVVLSQRTYATHQWEAARTCIFSWTGHRIQKGKPEMSQNEFSNRIWATITFSRSQQLRVSLHPTDTTKYCPILPCLAWDQKKVVKREKQRTCIKTELRAPSKSIEVYKSHRQKLRFGQKTNCALHGASQGHNETQTKPNIQL